IIVWVVSPLTERNTPTATTLPLGKTPSPRTPASGVAFHGKTAPAGVELRSTAPRRWRWCTPRLSVRLRKSPPRYRVVPEMAMARTFLSELVCHGTSWPYWAGDGLGANGAKAARREAGEDVKVVPSVVAEVLVNAPPANTLVPSVGSV